jgi:hypothetical protein
MMGETILALLDAMEGMGTQTVATLFSAVTRFPFLIALGTVISAATFLDENLLEFDRRLVKSKSSGATST